MGTATMSYYAPGHFAARLVQLAESQNWRCCYCGVAFVMSPRSHDHAPSFDEVTPQSLGGKKAWENQVAACRGCNTRRGIVPATKFWWLVREGRGIGAERKMLAERAARGEKLTALPAVSAWRKKKLNPIVIPTSERRRAYFELVYGQSPP